LNQTAALHGSLAFFGLSMSEFFHLWWSDWTSFLHMGRHGFYVWSSVAAVALALMGEQLALRLRAARTQRAQMSAQPAQGSAP
jgi:heme exporter protein CcmD